MSRPLKVGFLHPELGLGGAERLVVDAALGLQEAGHRVVVYTTRYDPARCFEATQELDLRVHGSWLPTQLGGRLRAPLAIVRMASLALGRELRRERFDVVVCDLVAHVLPLLRRTQRAPLVFYCHFPDALLAPAGGAHYRLYRALIDALESRGLARAHRLLANSRFTAAALSRAHPRLAALEPEVVYPGVDTRLPAAPPPDADQPRLLVLGRFAPDKGLGLAVESLAALRGRLSEARFAKLRLVLAGGFDARLRECRTTLEGLGRQLRAAGLEDRVDFALSPDDTQRLALLRAATCVVYTPEAEHFGLVPLEAMAAGRPVVAVARGGPVETVRDGVTGFLREPRAEDFAEAIAALVEKPDLAQRMGAAGRARVEAHFSRERFVSQLEAILRGLAEDRAEAVPA